VIVDGQSIVDLASRLTLALLIVSMALVFIRLVRGPQAVDRVVSLDLIAVMIVAFLAAYAVTCETPLSWMWPSLMP
jgi:multisubunit Na+/H+ antiporter MnhF subunit